MAFRPRETHLTRINKATSQGVVFEIENPPKDSGGQGGEERSDRGGVDGEAGLLHAPDHTTVQGFFVGGEG